MSSVERFWSALHFEQDSAPRRASTPLASLLLRLLRCVLTKAHISLPGLVARSLLKAQAASPSFTRVYAAVVAVLNTKLPEVGQLVLHRAVAQFQKAYQRSQKLSCVALARFLAHLVNQRVCDELYVSLSSWSSICTKVQLSASIALTLTLPPRTPSSSPRLALEMLTLLLERPTDDSVELASGFAREVGATLQESTPEGTRQIFDRFRQILQEGGESSGSGSGISQRVQYVIEALLAVKRSKFEAYPALDPKLDLVEEDDQITHEVSLDETYDEMKLLDIFKAQTPQEYIASEKRWRKVKAQILGDGDDDSDDDEDDGGDDLTDSDDSGSDADDESSDDEEEDEDEDEGGAVSVTKLPRGEAGERKLTGLCVQRVTRQNGESATQQPIKDLTEADIVNLRRTIYLTIMSSLTADECAHKLARLNIRDGQEVELVTMLTECCSQERTYLKYFGLICQRFCLMTPVSIVRVFFPNSSLGF